MKQFTIPSYTFTPGASGVGTVNLSGISGFNVKYLVAVINQTRGVVIYSTGDTATRYTNLAGTTLTLNVDTSTHNSGDVLQVIYEVTAADPLTDTQLRASAVPVSGTFFQATQPVSGTFFQATQPVSIASMPSTPVTGTFWQATQPVSAAALPLPSGAATSANQAPLTTSHPLPNASGAVVRQAPSEIWSVGFADVGSSLMATELTQRRLGTGVGVSQSSSNLVLTSGTTANSEFLARSVQSFRGALTARQKTILSQRIANQNFAVLLADKVGEGLSCTINSATSITVTLTAHGFTAQNVGQSMMVGAINGANGVPGRYAIASIPSVDTINFTVASWPASGSCTVDLFGYNYLWTQYTGTTATAANVDAQRKGWNSGVTAITINTTASPGHVVQTYADGRNVNWSDTVVASSTVSTVTARGSRIENIPDDNEEVYVYLWLWNGSTAPASTTTWTLGFLSVEDNANVPTYIAGVRPNGAQAAIAVLPTSQPVLVAGTAAIGDVGQQYRANATGAASGAHLVSAATTNATIVKGSAGRVLGWALANTNAAWRYVKLHNQTTTPTAGTGVVRTIAIPPNGLAQMKLEGGITFATGIGLTTVTGSADADTTAVGVGDIVGDIFFA